MKLSTLLSKIILVTSIIFSVNPGYSQGKIELSGGIGLPELFNLKLKYGQNTQIGVFTGFYPFKWYGDNVTDWSFGIEIMHHFIGNSKYVAQAPWYLSGSIGYHDLSVINHYENYNISFCPRIGRTINFSERIGTNLDIGLFLPLSPSKDNSYHFRLLPSGSISFLIRL